MKKVGISFLISAAKKRINLVEIELNSEGLLTLTSLVSKETILRTKNSQGAHTSIIFLQETHSLTILSWFLYATFKVIN